MTMIAELSITDQLLSAFPSGSYCLPALLQVARIVETEDVPTACVECLPRPRLLINPVFVAQHAPTPEKLTMLVLHELHHVVLGHTRLCPRVTPLDNLVFDAVINAMLCHLLPTRACTSLFTDFYKEDKFPECFLRPPANWRPGPDTTVKLPSALRRQPELQRLYQRLYSAQSASYSELREALADRVELEQLKGLVLLGDHSDEEDGASSAGTLEVRSPALLEETRRIVEQWPQPPNPIAGRSLADLLKSCEVSPPLPQSNCESLTRLLRLVGGRDTAGRIRQRSADAFMVDSVTPRCDRRSMVQWALGSTPILYRESISMPRMTHRGQKVHIYVDVSGSMGDMITPLYGAVLACREFVHPKVHLFSTAVADVSLNELRKGVCHTTHGTDIACVASHIRERSVRRAAILTDGYVGTPGVTDAKTLRACLLGVALTPGEQHSFILGGLRETLGSTEGRERTMTMRIGRVAEFVLPGHPDKLADAIADAIVQKAYTRERRALVGVEVAVHRSAVFIDGRVACKGAAQINFKELVSEVYASAGYGKYFPPRPTRLKLLTDLCLGPLRPGEAEFREVSDDQSIVTGYASSVPGTDYMPVEHAAARRLAIAVWRMGRAQPEIGLGPDGKVIVFLDEQRDGGDLRIEGVSISVQHLAGWDPVAARRAIDAVVRGELGALAAAVPGLEVGEVDLVINAAGDFIEGGPFGDNGLSGKKLVADFYGPRVPIGGGAMSGKDFFKVDRAGPLIARDIALAAVQRLGCHECLVTLGIRPGDREFRIVRVEAQNREPLDASRLDGLVDLRLAGRSDWPGTAGDLVEVARWGHFNEKQPSQRQAARKRRAG